MIENCMCVCMDFEADYKFLDVEMESGLLSIVSREV